MRELALSEQKTVNGGGQDGWDAFAGACDAWTGLAIADPSASAGFDILGGICSAIGSQKLIDPHASPARMFPCEASILIIMRW